MQNCELVYHLNEIRKLYQMEFNRMGIINISIDRDYISAFAFERNDDENKLIDVTIWDI